MKRMTITTLIVAGLIGTLSFASTGVAQDEIPYEETFRFDNCNLQPRGKNGTYTPLTPGYNMIFRGEEDGEEEMLWVSILQRTKKVDGVRCAVLREVEWVNGELVEVSWNYYAICRTHKDVFYFGEDVDIYEDGVVVRHDGAWLAGVDGNKPGLIMPGNPLPGSRYFQEIAPGIALDRAEHQSTDVTVEVPAGTFEQCLEVIETTPLEPGSESHKLYAPNVGLLVDGPLELVWFGNW